MKKLILSLFLGIVFAATPLLAEVPTVEKEELKSLLGQESLVVVDVRTGRDWSTSEFKIQGAVRGGGKDHPPIESLPKENTFVFYCA